MPIVQLQQQVDEWINKYGVRYFNELTNMAILTEEVGEVARVIARQYGEQSFKESDDSCIQVIHLTSIDNVEVLPPFLP